MVFLDYTQVNTYLNLVNSAKLTLPDFVHKHFSFTHQNHNYSLCSRPSKNLINAINTGIHNALAVPGWVNLIKIRCLIRSHSMRANQTSNFNQIGVGWVMGDSNPLQNLENSKKCHRTKQTQKERKEKREKPIMISSKLMLLFIHVHVYYVNNNAVFPKCSLTRVTPSSGRNVNLTINIHLKRYIWRIQMDIFIQVYNIFISKTKFLFQFVFVFEMATIRIRVLSYHSTINFSPELLASFRQSEIVCPRFRQLITKLKKSIIVDQKGGL